ncbi:unnamed protein product [Closterium sp. NIES-65]|nr:unnamed protein product [Closterium sp. NIES-65]
MGLRSGGRDGGREQATKVRAWAVAGEEEKDEKVREWAVAEGEEKDEKEKAGGCEFVAADTEGKNEKVREWALAEREEKDEKEEAGVCELVAAGTEGMNEKVKEWAATEGEGKNEREGTWAAGAKTGVTMKDRMQAEEQAQGNKLAEQHVRKLREGRPELLGEAEQESEEVGAGEPLATGEKADHAMEEAENRAAWEQAKAAEHLEEVIPVSVEDLHTVQLRDACSREQWQQQEGKGIRAAREAGQRSPRARSPVQRSPRRSPATRGRGSPGRRWDSGRREQSPPPRPHSAGSGGRRGWRKGGGRGGNGNQPDPALDRAADTFVEVVRQARASGAPTHVHIEVTNGPPFAADPGQVAPLRAPTLREYQPARISAPSCPQLP